MTNIFNVPTLGPFENMFDFFWCIWSGPCLNISPLLIYSFYLLSHGYAMCHWLGACLLLSLNSAHVTYKLKSRTYFSPNCAGANTCAGRLRWNNDFRRSSLRSNECGLTRDPDSKWKTYQLQKIVFLASVKVPTRQGCWNADSLVLKSDCKKQSAFLWNTSAESTTEPCLI